MRIQQSLRRGECHAEASTDKEAGSKLQGGKGCDRGRTGCGELWPGFPVSPLRSETTGHPLQRDTEPGGSGETEQRGSDAAANQALPLGPEVPAADRQQGFQFWVADDRKIRM